MGKIIALFSDREKLEPGVLCALLIADGIVADVEDLLCGKVEVIPHRFEHSRGWLGCPDFTRKEEVLEEGRQAQVGEDTTETPVEVGKDDAGIASRDSLENFVGAIVGQPGSRGFKMVVKGFEALVESLGVRPGGSRVVENFLDQFSPPHFFVRVDVGRVGRERGRRLSEDLPETELDSPRIALDPEVACDTGIRVSDGFRKVDQGARGVEAAGRNRRGKHGT